MINQRSSLSIQNEVPEKWQEKYLIKRINEDDIEISLEERNMIIAGLTAGMKFVQIRKHTLMLNAMKSMDPKWGEDNIPPRPKLDESFSYEMCSDKAIRHLVATNIDEIKLWDSLFGKEVSVGTMNLLNAE